MNYNDESYPKNFDVLIDKCDATVNHIRAVFAENRHSKVKDLYKIGQRNTRSETYFEKLRIAPNIKKDGKAKKENELKGLYVFAEEVDGQYMPIYVGISRTVFRRLYQHAFGKKHNETSFCYLKAKHLSGHKTSRRQLDWALIEMQQRKLHDYAVVVIPEPNDYDLYFMEVYIAGKLKTKWNSFKTH